MGGTLTAEQVREAAHGHYKLRMVRDVDGFDVPQVVFDWQAIADELNARAERTCRIVTDGHGWWECDECGGTIDWDSCDVNDPPACAYCPNCGRKVEQ